MPVQSNGIRNVSARVTIRLTLEQEFPSSMQVRDGNGALLALLRFRIRDRQFVSLVRQITCLHRKKDTVSGVLRPVMDLAYVEPGSLDVILFGRAYCQIEICFENRKHASCDNK
jgi:hypothetical protein